MKEEKKKKGAMSGAEAACADAAALPPTPPRVVFFRLGVSRAQPERKSKRVEGCCRCVGNARERGDYLSNVLCAIYRGWRESVLRIILRKIGLSFFVFNFCHFCVKITKSILKIHDIIYVLYNYTY